MKERSKKKLATSTWVCHVEKCEMTKRADDQKVEGKLTREKPKLRWVIALTLKEWEKNGKHDR